MISGFTGQEYDKARPNYFSDLAGHAVFTAFVDGRVTLVQWQETTGKTSRYNHHCTL